MPTFRLDRASRSRPSLRRLAAGALLCATIAGAAYGPAAWAARTFPQNSRQVRITAAADDAIVADGDALHLAPGVLIFTTTNATLVRSALPVGIVARIQLDLNGDVRRIWLLADDEILHWPWYEFWHFRQPQADPLEPVLTN